MKYLTAFIAMLALTTTPAAAQTAAKPAAGGFDHKLRAKILVTDLPRAIKFYEALGMKEGFHHGALQIEVNYPGEKSGILLALDPDHKLGLVPGTGYIMLSLPDVKATAVALRKAGYPNIAEPSAFGTATLLRVKDPDGNMVELLSSPVDQPGR